MGKRETTTRIKSVLLSTRIREDLFLAFKSLTNEIQLSQREIIELALIEQILSFEKKLEKDGIDYKNIARLVKLEKLRNIQKIERNEFLSSQLIIPRIHTDIYKLIVYHKKSKNLPELIRNYIEIRKKECKHYKNNEEILSYIKEYETLLNKSKIDDIKRRIEDKTDLNTIDIRKQK